MGWISGLLRRVLVSPFKVAGAVVTVPVKVVFFPLKIISRISSAVLVLPFKLVWFLHRHVIILGLLAGTRLLVRGMFRLLFSPLFSGLLVGAFLVFVFRDEQRRKKLRELFSS